MKYSKTIAGITIEICEKAIGEDLVLTLSGGEKPHIGCVVQAVPRPSLSGDGTISVCLLYTSPSPRDRSLSRMPSSA